MFVCHSKLLCVNFWILQSPNNIHGSDEVQRYEEYEDDQQDP